MSDNQEHERGTLCMNEFTHKTKLGTDITVRVHEDDCHPLPSRPRPTCLLLGWLGGSSCQLAKYGSIYEELGFNTVCATTSLSVVFAYNKTEIPRFFLLILRTLAADKSLCSSSALLVHFFSNAGAFCAPVLADLLRGSSALSADNSALAQGLKSCLVGVIFDSAPAYPSFAAGCRALVTGGVSQHGPKHAYVVQAVLLLTNCVGLATRAWRAHGFWNAVRKADYGVPELYLYSGSDVLCDASRVEELIRERKTSHKGKSKAGYVRAMKVDDAPHVQILRVYPELYSQCIAEFVQLVLGGSTSLEKMRNPSFSPNLRARW